MQETEHSQYADQIGIEIKELDCLVDRVLDVLPPDQVAVGDPQRDPSLCAFAEYYLRAGVSKQDKKGCATVGVLGEKSGSLEQSVRIGGKSLELKKMGLKVIKKNWMKIEEKYQTAYFGREAALVIGSGEEKYSDLVGWWLVRDETDKSTMVPDRFFWPRFDDFDKNGQNVRGVGYTLPLVAEFLESKGVGSSVVLGFSEKVVSNAKRSESKVAGLEELIKKPKPNLPFNNNDYLNALDSLNSLYWSVLNYLPLMVSGNEVESSRERFVNKVRTVVSKIKPSEKNAIEFIHYNKIKDDYLAIWSEGEVVNMPSLLINIFVGDLALLTDQESETI